MGLDMYLHAKKYIQKLDWQKLNSNDEYKLNSPEVIDPKWTEIVENAGLQDVATDIYGANVEVTCAYWRKANQIHKWFVDNVQDGNDDCDLYYVSHDKLKELLATARQCLLHKDPSLLPPQSGFFFGNTDINEWYWEDIKDTIKQLKRVSELPDFEQLYFSYQSSW